jgi:hypothetical protein
MFQGHILPPPLRSKSKPMPLFLDFLPLFLDLKKKSVGKEGNIPNINTKSSEY